MTMSRKRIDSALNPAWRDSVVHLISSQGWDDSTPQARVDELVKDMTNNKPNALRQLDPNSGCYYEVINWLIRGMKTNYVAVDGN